MRRFVVLMVVSLLVSCGSPTPPVELTKPKTVSISDPETWIFYTPKQIALEHFKQIHPGRTPVVVWVEPVGPPSEMSVEYLFNDRDADKRYRVLIRFGKVINNYTFDGRIPDEGIPK